jgi:transcriptional regulator with XRE-family HTH domain
MGELGQYLVGLRNAKKLSQEDVAKATKINLIHLAALEEGNFENLPAEIYVKGFLKSYGLFVGADFEKLYTLYESEKPKPKARRIFSGKPKEPPPFAPPIAKVKTQKKITVPRKIEFNRTTLIIIGCIIVILVIVLIARSGNKTSPPITSVTDVVVPDSVKNLDSRLASPMTKEELTQEIKLKFGDINPAWALGRADSLTIAIRAKQKTWVLVEADYGRVYKGDIGVKDTLKFRAKNAFFLTMGNPNVMHLSVNGFELAEWPQRTFPMDLDVNRGNILSLLEGALGLPAPEGTNIIGSDTPQIPDTTGGEKSVNTGRTRKQTTEKTTPKKEKVSKPLQNVNTPPPEGPTREVQPE